MDAHTSTIIGRLSHELAIVRHAFATTVATLRVVINERDAAIAAFHNATQAARTRNAWYPDEDAILRDTYARGGGPATQAALATAGFKRTRSAIGQRASILRITAPRNGQNWRPWTTPELEALRSTYPAEPQETVLASVAEAGTIRTWGAIAWQGARQGLSRPRGPRVPLPVSSPASQEGPSEEAPAPERHSPTPKPVTASTRRPGATWTPEEDTIITSTHPTHGLTPTTTALHAAGFTHRTPSAIASRVERLGTHATRNQKKPTSNAKQHVLRLISDYRGLPLTATDVAEELSISRETARHQLISLTKAGVINERQGPATPDGRGAPPKLYFTPEQDAA